MMLSLMRGMAAHDTPTAPFAHRLNVLLLHRDGYIDSSRDIGCCRGTSHLGEELVNKKEIDLRILI